MRPHQLQEGIRTVRTSAIIANRLSPGVRGLYVLPVEFDDPGGLEGVCFVGWLIIVGFWRIGAEKGLGIRVCRQGNRAFP